MTDPNSTTASINVADLSLDQLVQLSQGLGRQADAIREKRAYLSRKIAERLAAGERNKAPADEGINGTADGAVIEAKTG